MATSLRRVERPWHRRSPLWIHETEIRRMLAEGYSLRQVVDHLGLGVHRSTLHRFLRRAARSAGATVSAATRTAATPVQPGADDADDAAAEALLAATDFSPPPKRK